MSRAGPTETPMTPAILSGPILSVRNTTTVTTIWSDGDVVRTDWLGRSQVRPAVAPVREPKPAAEAAKLKEAA